MFQTPPEALRNTDTLQAWRLYSARASRPLIFASMFPGVVVGVLIPINTVLMRHHHPFIAIAIMASALTAGIAGLIWAVLQVRAYRRAHPFVPPPTPGSWTNPQR